MKTKTTKTTKRSTEIIKRPKNKLQLIKEQELRQKENFKLKDLIQEQEEFILIQENIIYTLQEEQENLKLINRAKIESIEYLNKIIKEQEQQLKIVNFKYYAKKFKQNDRN